MANFNSGKNIAVVIQLQKAKDKQKAFSSLQEKAASLFGLGRYAYILHDKDVLDNGEIKGAHVHLVLCADKAQSSANWVKHFAEGLGLEEDAISVEMQGSEKKCLRYLLHLDDGAKHQYDRSEVKTNMDNVCKKAWDATSGFVSNPTLEQLIEASKQGAKGVYNLVGLASVEKALRVLDRFNAEEESERYYFSQVNDLFERLSEFTANREYLRTGSIPLKDFQKALDDTSDTLKRMIRRKRVTASLIEKGMDGKKK